MGFYLSKEVTIEGKKHQGIYLNGELQRTFDIFKYSFIENHNDYIDYLRSLGHKSEAERKEDKKC